MNVNVLWASFAMRYELAVICRLSKNSTRNRAVREIYKCKGRLELRRDNRGTCRVWGQEHWGTEKT